MRSLVLIAAMVALSACSQGADETPAPADTTDAAAVPAETADAAGGTTSALAAEDAAGTYTVTWADGTITSTTINDDGTYVDMMEGEETAHGVWAVKEGKSCLTPEGGAELCWTDSAPGADGSWTATADDGTTVTVVKADTATS
ncbi:hypothetical protein [Pelagerythrobacter aerophilus]|nr:hypothetical protein [Pelagerythrobacter aerophilus]